MTKRSKLLFPARHLGSSELAACLATLPMEDVVVVLHERFHKLASGLPHAVVSSFDDLDTLTHELARWAKQQEIAWIGVLAIDDEERFGVSALLAENLGISFDLASSAPIAANKYLQKLGFRREGVPTGDFTLLDAEADLKSDLLPYPNILKLVTGSGSEFLMRNRDRDELQLHLKQMREHALAALDEDSRLQTFEHRSEGAQHTMEPSRHFLLEEWLEGEEYSCDFMYAGGEVSVLRVVRKLEGPFLGHFGGYHLLGRHSIEATFAPGGEKLNALCRGVARALELKTDALCMVDFKLHEGRMAVIESSIRPGFSTFLPLMHALRGYTPLSLFARWLLYREPPPRTLPNGEALVVHFFVPRAGIVRSIDRSGLDALRPSPSYLGERIYLSIGEEVSDSPVDHFDLLAGYLMVKDPPLEELERFALSLQQSIRVEMGD